MRSLGLCAVLATTACVEDREVGGRGGGPGLGGEGDSDSGSSSAGDSGGDGTASSSGGGDGGGDDDGGGTPKFDVADGGASSSGGGGDCEGEGGGDQVDFAYIWIANSNEGTISKIDTATMVEEGRYPSRPDASGNPSRTSVSLSGDVAVANRNGGVTKIRARVSDCREQNGQPGIQTSNGNVPLPWDVEECIAWHTPFSGPQRPVAWAPGTWNEATCRWEDELLWTARQENNVARVYRLDGEDGTVLDDITLNDVPSDGNGPYGGAVDQHGHFFFIHKYGDGAKLLVRVDADTLQHERIPVPEEVCSPYGFTVDSEGRSWIASQCGRVARYSPASGAWDIITDFGGAGLQEDAEGRMWIAGDGQAVVRAVDSNSLQTLMQVTMPGSDGNPLYRGLSIDFQGKVWVVPWADVAHRLDPATQQYETFTGLNGAYTYSDMTGWGLSNVVPPQG
jgi:hypothetical protein